MTGVLEVHKSTNKENFFEIINQEIYNEILITAFKGVPIIILNFLQFQSKFGSKLIWLRWF